MHLSNITSQTRKKIKRFFIGTTTKLKTARDEKADEEIIKFFDNVSMSFDNIKSIKNEITNNE